MFDIGPQFFFVSILAPAYASMRSRSVAIVWQCDSHTPRRLYFKFCNNVKNQAF